MAISFQLNKQRNQLFKETMQGFGYFPLALLFSFCLMCVDKHYHLLPVHRIFASLVFPIQYAVNTPGRVMSWTQGVWSTKQALLNETRALHEEQLHLKVSLQQLMALQDENQRLKQLLNAAEQSVHKTAMANILSMETSQSRHTLLINKGKKDGVLPGQLVLDTQGVAGQIIAVGLMTSTVLLISDASSAIPVRNQRTGETTILAGTHQPAHLSLIYLPKTTTVQVGDVLVTSSLGSQYPEGYPVGVVSQVDNPGGEAFVRIDVTPFTHYYRDGMVLLVWLDNPHKKTSEQIT